jgi:Mrp family chromosome partitioning ATPase
MSKQTPTVRRPETEQDLHKIADGAVVVCERPRSRDIDLNDRTREEAVKLVQRLFITPGHDTPRVVLFSGVEPGAGCSWVCARTAEILADNMDGLVCIVDANCRSATVHKQLQAENDGTAPDKEWIASPRRLFEPRKGSNLWLLSHKPASSDWQTPESLDRLQTRIADLRKDFSYVLIDAPPLNSFADATLLAKMADGLVMVIEANTTRREVARKAKDVLDAAGVRVLGAVLNKRTFPTPGWVYRRL